MIGVCDWGKMLWYLGSLANKDWTAMYRRPSERDGRHHAGREGGGAAGEANMHEISIKFPHILPFSLSQHCYFPPRLALLRCPAYIFLPRPSGERFKWTLFYRRV